MGELVLRDVLIIFAVAIPVVLVTHRLNLPSIVGFLLTGILIGPAGLGFINNIQRIDLLAEVGVALLLFHIGLEFSASSVKGMKSVMLGCGFFQVLLTVLAGMGFALLFGWSLTQGFLFGCAAALSSTAIALAFLSYKRWLDSPSGRIATGVLIFQDLAIVPMLVILTFISSRNAGQHAAMGVIIPFVKVAAVFGIMWLIYRFVLGQLLHQVARIGSKELFIIILIGMALGFGWFTQRLGLSFALGAFLGGLMVSATPFRFHALSEIAPFRACVSGLFFVSVGMLVSPQFIMQNMVQVAALVVFIVVIKTIIASGSVMLFGYPVTVAVIVGMMLSQMGEFSFLLVRVGFKEAVIGKYFYDMLIAASGITIVIAPVMMELSAFIGPLFERFSPSLLTRRKKHIEIKTEVERMDNHAIICGFGPLGETIGHMLEKSGINYVILELNPVRAKKLQKAKKTVFIGDGASSELLSHSGIERAKLLAIAVPDYLNALAIIRQARRLNEQIMIVARARYRDQVDNFYEAGADIVICEELEAGVEMGRYVLLEIGVPEEDVNRFISEVRAFGSADFF
jgi:CPA2 family monovalent cation:H+ antiporter-2